MAPRCRNCQRKPRAGITNERKEGGVLKKPIKRKAYKGEYNLVVAIPKESLVDMLNRCKNMANELMTLIDQLQDVADGMLPVKSPKSVKG